ncbi:hypothetical protein JTB14_009272 [Gonioctena quinquepunctata]|nr:hypothetical protein JTB14_009272 [Gonioctena quinquepunctata]
MNNNVGIQVNALELNMFFNTLTNIDRNESDDDKSADLILKNKKSRSRRQRKNNNKIIKKKSNINKDGNVCNDDGLNNEYRNNCSIQEELSQSLKDTPPKRGLSGICEHLKKCHQLASKNIEESTMAGAEVRHKIFVIGDEYA